MTNLSENQKKIVFADDGPRVVIASAGSGKTRVLTERVRFLLQNRSGRFKILALTFTNKAAEEMQERLSDIPNISDRTFIGTIHHFCLDLIRSKGSSIGIDQMPIIFESDQDRKQVLLQALDSNLSLKSQLERRPKKEQATILANTLESIGIKKRSLYGLHSEQQTAESSTLEVFNDYNRLLALQNAIDFDDVICLAYRILSERPAVASLYRRIFKYICVDEAQDLNFAQYELIRALCGEDNRNVLLVGDPNQAIYGFNGSDKRFMTERFPRDFGGETLELQENYRSSKAVLDVANAISPGALDSTKAVISGEFKIKGFESELEEASAVANKIETMLSQGVHPDIEGAVNYESFCVLARNKYVFRHLESQLNERSIPFFFKRTGTALGAESDLLTAFDLGLRVLSNPIDRLHFNQLLELFEISTDAADWEGDALNRLGLIRGLLDTKSKADFQVVYTALETVERNITGYTKALDLLAEHISTGDGKEKDADEKALTLADIEMFRSTWANYLRSSSVEERNLAGFRNYRSLGLGTQGNIAESGITLGSVHSVKGLEFDIVFLLGMNDGVFPDYRAVRSGGAALEEERNNAFVAVTRSKRLLYVTYPQFRFMPWDAEVPVRQRPSQFFVSLIRTGE